MEEGKALLLVITSHQSGTFSHLPHTHTRVDTHSNTHTGGHIVATTPFHSLLIFGLTERPSEGRTHMNVAPKERRREIKIKKRDGEIEEEEEEREEEEPAGWK